MNQLCDKIWNQAAQIEYAIDYLKNAQIHYTVQCRISTQIYTQAHNEIWSKMSGILDETNF